METANLPSVTSGFVIPKQVAVFFLLALLSLLDLPARSRPERVFSRSAYSGWCVAADDLLYPTTEDNIRFVPSLSSWSPGQKSNLMKSASDFPPVSDGAERFQCSQPARLQQDCLWKLNV